MPWAVASGGEQPKGKREEQPKRTLKKIEGRVRGQWKTIAPKDWARGQTNWGTQEEARNHKTKSGEMDLGTPEQGKDDLLSTLNPAVEQASSQGERGCIQREALLAPSI